MKTQRLAQVSFGALVSLVGTIGLAFPGRAFPDENDASPTITIQTYNYSQASPTVLVEAEREAGRILMEAGLRAIWLECPVGLSSPSPKGLCKNASEATDLRLRVLDAPVANKFQDTVFGFTVHPVLASVYYEYAARRAKSDDAEFEAPIILGCAIAHEVGHLLLGTNSHSDVGIMQPRWEPNQFRQLMIGNLAFTPEQSKLMRAAARTRQAVTQEEHSPAQGPVKLPIRLYRGYLLIAEGAIGNLQKLNFLVDTGACPSVVDQKIAHDLRLAEQPGRVNLWNKSVQTRQVVIPSLNLGPVRVESLPVLAEDLSFLEKALGFKVHAIVGLDVLRNSSFTIDYRSKEMLFGSTESLSYSAPFETDTPVVTIRMEFQNRHMRLVVDSGGPDLMLFRSRMLDSTALQTLGTETVTDAGGSFQRIKVRIPEAYLGIEPIGAQVAFVVDDQKDEGDNFDGVLGVKAPQFWKISFDFEHHRFSWER